MTEQILLFPVLLPAIAGLLMVLLSKRFGSLKELIAVGITLVNLVLAVYLYPMQMSYAAQWFGSGIEFSLRLYQFSAFILAAVAGFGFLIVLYSVAFMRTRQSLSQYYAYTLLSLAMVNGAVLADNLIALLFFWEGLLITLFGLIFIGGPSSFKSAVKAFVIVGITDLCMMFGIGLTAFRAGTLTISQIHLPLDAAGAVAFTFLMIGAISKAGSMPFHSWIPDAAVDAPLPFMAFLPAALEKLLGIYFLARISLDMFELTAGSWVSLMLMIIGAITILLAVMMALIQKDYKRLLSYHAISQVGYMILGIGTAVPAGIVGGLFHMINHAMYKSCLFLTGGAVERQTGTTDLEKLGGIGRKMPVTFICFIIAAAAISGVPPFNGFFSKELVYDGALERGWIFYAAAILGSFFTAASFLKLGHSAFLGKASGAIKETVKEAPAFMLIPMIVIASGCVFFGVYNALPLNNFIQPVLGGKIDGHSFAGWPTSTMLVAITVTVIIAALANHWYGISRTGKGIGAVDHIHYAPVISNIYNMAEKRYFDPYNIGLVLVNGISRVAWWIDRGIDWIYSSFTVKVTYAASTAMRKLHSDGYPAYIAWALAGVIIVIAVTLKRI